ncbi:hypothetical protein [Streptomyces sp. NPDC059247]|uniref:hypothetical protein n=1 Tax=Streptomyces sp. NPDC059247 TaxID=3346790 RepID=UPI0036A29B8F
MSGAWRWARRAVGRGGVAVLAGLLVGCSAGAAGDGSRDVSRSPGRQVPYWLDDVTPEAVARQLNVRLPASATDARAAHQKGFQDDGLLLSFVLPAIEVDGFVARLAPERPLRARSRPVAGAVKPMTPFTRLGLPEPESIADVREGQACAPCQGDVDSLNIAVVGVDGRTSRIYLRATD